MIRPWSDALSQALADFDGKRTAPLERFAASHSADADLIAELCHFAASDDQNLQTGATWLLKHFGVTAAQLNASQTVMLLSLLTRHTSWLPRLHVLQMMAALTVPAPLALPLMDALADQARGKNAFIRAWSVHGAAAIADQHPAQRDRALDLLASADQDEAASVRARMRRLRKDYDWLS